MAVTEEWSNGEGTTVKVRYLTFGILMAIIALVFTLLEGIKVEGDSSNFFGRIVRLSEYFTINLERVFPNQYKFIKAAELWLERLLNFIRRIPTGAKQDQYRRRAEDKRTREMMNNGQ